MGEEFLTPNLKAREMMLLCGKTQNINHPILVERIDFYLSSLSWIILKSRFYLMATKKMMIALALLKEPKGLILDEPFEGLDYVMTNKLLGLLCFLLKIFDCRFLWIY